MGMLFTAFGCLASAPDLESDYRRGSLHRDSYLSYFFGVYPLLFGDQIPAAPFFEFISSQNHLREFSRGLIDTRTNCFLFINKCFLHIPHLSPLGFPTLETLIASDYG